MLFANNKAVQVFNLILAKHHLLTKQITKMKNTKKFVTPMLLVLIGLATLSFIAKDEITLRLHPQQGKSYTVVSKATSMNMMEVQGQTINMSQTMETNQSFTVKEATDTQSVMEAQIESMKMSVSQMGMKFEYDSDHPEKTSPMIADQTKELAKSIKKPSMRTYDAMGKMISEKDEESMNSLANAIIKMPEEPISVGSTWKTSNTQSVSDMDMTVEFTYTVTAISKKSIDVSFKGNILENKDNITGNYSGTASINPTTGLIMKSNTKSTVAMTISQQGLTIPTTISGNATVTVTEK